MRFSNLSSELVVFKVLRRTESYEGTQQKIVARKSIWKCLSNSITKMIREPRTENVHDEKLFELASSTYFHSTFALAFELDVLKKALIAVS